MRSQLKLEEPLTIEEFASDIDTPAPSAGRYSRCSSPFISTPVQSLARSKRVTETFDEIYRWTPLDPVR